MEELEIVDLDRDVTREFCKEDNYLQLTKLQKLKGLNLGRNLAPVVNILKNLLPNLHIAPACHSFNIAKNWPLENGIWEIKEKQFMARTEPIYCKECGNTLDPFFHRYQDRY